MPALTTTGNDALIDRFFDDVMNGQNPAAAAELLTNDFLVHHPLLAGGEGHTPQVVQLMTTFRAAFARLHYTVDDRVVDGRFAEAWVGSDLLGLFRQLGRFPEVSHLPTHAA